MAAPAHTIIRNGRLLDIAGHAAPPADILIAGDTIAAIGPPGLAAPDDAVVIEATDRLLMPGLVNAHHHMFQNLTRATFFQMRTFAIAAARPSSVLSPQSSVLSPQYPSATA